MQCCFKQNGIGSCHFQIVFNCKHAFCFSNLLCDIFHEKFTIQNQSIRHGLLLFRPDLYVTLELIIFPNVFWLIIVCFENEQVFLSLTVFCSPMAGFKSLLNKELQIYYAMLSRWVVRIFQVILLLNRSKKNILMPKVISFSKF